MLRESFRRLGVASSATVLAALVVLVAPASARAETHRVLNVPRDFATIQAAIDAARGGDAVTVAAGTFTEQLVITKDIDVRGAGASATVVKAPATLAPYGMNTNTGVPLAAIVQVGRGAHVRLSGVTVTGPVPCEYVDEGIGIVEDATLELTDSRVTRLMADGCAGEAYGIVYGVSPSYAINGVPGGTTGSGRASHVVVDSFQSDGIVVVAPYGRSPSRVTLSDNTVDGGTPVNPAAQVGILVRLNSVGQVTGNTVANMACSLSVCGFDFFAEIQSAGGVLEGANGSTFTGNHISGADIGFLNYNSVGSTVAGNTLSDNYDYGLIVADVDGVTKGNTVTGGRIGIVAIAMAQDTTELSRGDHVSGASEAAIQTFTCCGYHASVTVK